MMLSLRIVEDYINQGQMKRYLPNVAAQQRWIVHLLFLALWIG